MDNKFLVVFLHITLLTAIAQETCDTNYETDLLFTCCNKQRLKPGLDLWDLKDDCISAANGEKCTVVGVAWSIYNCTVYNALKGKPLTLANFADVMVINYPANVSNPIKKLVLESNFDSSLIESLEEGTSQDKECEETSFEDNHDATVDILWRYKELIAMRNIYYESEKRVCELQPPPQPTNKTFQNDVTCFTWMEESYRLGGCCNGIITPIPIIPAPYIPLTKIANFTATKIMPIAGEYIGSNLSNYNLNLCYSTSRQMLLLREYKTLNLKALNTSVMSFKLPDYKKLAEEIIPKYFNQNLKDEMKEFMIFNLIDNVNYTEFLQFNRSTSYWLREDEYKTFINESMTKYLFWHCTAHSILSRRMKDFDMAPWCGNPLKEEFTHEDYD